MYPFEGKMLTTKLKPGLTIEHLGITFIGVTIEELMQIANKKEVI